MIRQSTSRVNQVLPPDFAFSRASTGYNGKGKLFMPNQIRLENELGVGLVANVEEGTSNLIPVDKQKFVGWVSDSGATVTITQGQAVPEWNTKNATRIQTSGGTSLTKCYYYAGLSVLNQNYCISIFVKNLGSTAAKILVPAGSKSQTVLPGEIAKVNLSTVGDGTSGFGIWMQTANDVDSLDIIAWQPQIEAKAYPTSFIETTRAAESLTMPVMGLPPTQGTVEGIVEITDLVKRQDGVNSIRIIRIPGVASNGIDLRHWPTNDQFQLVIWNDVGETSTVSWSDSVLPSKWYYFKVYWTTSIAKIEFWDLELKAKIVDYVINDPKLPSAFASKMYIGSYNGVINFPNTRFGTHRLSNIARTADPDFNNLMPRDGNTVALMDFDEIQYRSVQNLVM